MPLTTDDDTITLDLNVSLKVFCAIKNFQIFALLNNKHQPTIEHIKC